MFDLTADAFELADRYRMCVIVLSDAFVGQMMEPLELPDEPFPPPPPKPWALTGCKGRPHNTVRSLILDEEELEEHNRRLLETARRAEREETRWEAVGVDDADVVLVAYGSPARICREAVARGRKQGLRVGLIRPITLYPFPSAAIREAAERSVRFLVVEMSLGQMAEDVRLALEGRRPVDVLGRPAVLSTATEILERAASLIEAGKP
jgi:2-oxoglutarate ferredoxin oxidoreductase subunit alpha